MGGFKYAPPSHPPKQGRVREVGAGPVFPVLCVATNWLRNAGDDVSVGHVIIPCPPSRLSLQALVGVTAVAVGSRAATR